MLGNINKNKLNNLMVELNKYKIKEYISRENKLKINKLKENIKILKNKIELNKLNEANKVLNENLRNSRPKLERQKDFYGNINTSTNNESFENNENINTNTSNELLNPALNKLHKNFNNYLNRYIKNHPENNINIEEIRSSFNKQFETAQRKLNNFKVNSNSLQKEANKANKNANIFRRKPKLPEN